MGLPWDFSSLFLFLLNKSVQRQNVIYSFVLLGHIVCLSFLDKNYFIYKYLREVTTIR